MSAGDPNHDNDPAMLGLHYLETLAGGLCHELNQPLSAIVLYTESLKLALAKGRVQDVIQRMDTLLDQATKLNDMLLEFRSLSTFSGIDPLAESRLEMILPAALKVVGSQLTNHGVRWSNLITVPPLPVKADRRLVHHMAIDVAGRILVVLDRIGDGEKNLDIMADNTVDDFTTLRFIVRASLDSEFPEFGEGNGITESLVAMIGGNIQGRALNNNCYKLELQLPVA